MSRQAYVDVRGPWPVLIEGDRATTLIPVRIGQREHIAERSITVEDAQAHRAILQGLEREPFNVEKGKE